jgi:GAF domain-containing protein
MIPPSIPDNESERLQALWSLKILDTKPEKRFDLITKQATELLKVPISTISLIDKKREWYKSCRGLSITELPREISFCAHAIAPLSNNNILIVEDAQKDPRFADNPQVVGWPFIRFYAGVPLRDLNSKLIIGVLCIKDTKPRSLSGAELQLLFELAKQTEIEFQKK